MVLLNAVLVLLVGTPDAGVSDAGSSAWVCPASRAGVKAGAACSEADAVCTWGVRWCECGFTQCTTAAGPIPGCAPRLAWRCRDDGCPRSAVGACTPEKRLCTYDDGLCASSMQCERGAWKFLGASCRPSSAHGH